MSTTCVSPPVVFYEDACEAGDYEKRYLSLLPQKKVNVDTNSSSNVVERPVTATESEAK